jgi:hypothetical protein
MSKIEDREHDPLYCIYFYYIRYDGGQGSSMNVYYDFDKHEPIKSKADLVKRATALAENAMKGDFAPPPCGHSFAAVPWRRKSYLVFLLDDPVLNFPGKEALSLEFQDSQAETVNHSFFNADKWDITAMGRQVTVLSCVDLMQHKSGRPMMDGEVETYTVDLSLSHNRTVRGDGGTNQGGPIPPPMPA